MAAQVHLDGGRKPAERVQRFAQEDERGLRKSVLAGDRLEQGVWKPFGEQTDPGRISREHLR